MANLSVPLSQLRMHGYLGHILDDPDRPGNTRDHETRPGGWHIFECPGPMSEGEEWLASLVAGSRGPALLISFYEAELGLVRGLGTGPRATPWAVRLHSADAAKRYPTPKHRHLHRGLPPEWMIADTLLSGDAALTAIAAWSTDAGGHPDHDALAALLAEQPSRFPDDSVARLLDAVGLTRHVDPAPYPHALSAWSDLVKLEQSLTALRPGRHRALDCHEHRDCFALVRMRDTGDYVLEYREEEPEVMHQTTTDSLDRVIAAMRSWAQGDVLWRDDFEWTQIAPAPR